MLHTLQKGCNEVPGPVPQKGSVESGSTGEFDGVAELFELGDEESSASIGLVFAGEVVGAQFGVGGFIDEQVPADHQDGVSDSDQSTLFASSFGDPSEPDSEVAVFGANR